MSEARAMAPKDQVWRHILDRGDVLSEWARGNVGSSVRLHIPLVDQITLRAQAAILRELANKLELHSHGREGDAHALFMAASEIRISSGRLQSTKRGVRKKGA